MQYTLTQQLDTRQSVLIDIYDVAHYVQALLDQVLQAPPAGLYLPDQLEPVLRAGGAYWYEKQNFLETSIEAKATINNGIQQYGGYGQSPTIYGNDPIVKLHTTPWQYYTYEYVPVTNLQEVALSPWDVLDSNPNFDSRPKRVVLPHHLAPKVSLAPSLPVMAIKLILQLVINDIDGSRAFRTQRPLTIEEVVAPFLRPEYNGVALERDDRGQVISTSPHIATDRWFQDTLSMVWDAVLPILTPIRNQLRNNPFQMSSVQHHDGYQLRVDQLGDYRIMAWEQITADLEYQRWLRARSNGDWDRYVSEQEEIIANNAAYIATDNPYR